MIFGIDAREIQDGVSTGTGRVLDNFLRWFSELDDEHRCILFSEKKLQIEYGRRIIAVVAPAFPLTAVWDQVLLPRLMRRHRIDFLFSPYYKVPITADIPVVSTIFDLMYLFYPMPWRGSGPFSRLYYRIFGTIMAAKARIIFTCSEYSKTEILRFYRVPESNVAVIPLGLSDRYRVVEDREASGKVMKKFGITGRYLLYTGNFKPHKNVAILVDVVEKVRKMFPDITLVLAGNKDANYLPVGERIGRSSCASSIVTTGRVTLDEQIILYNGATVFICPSLYEGFGYPPLEAMACGTPVVSSDRTSLAEIIGDAALRCDPLNAVDISEKTCSLLQSADLSRQCRTRGLAQSRKFSNRLFCERFYALLHSCGGT